MTDHVHSVRNGHRQTNPAWVLEDSWDDRDGYASQVRSAEQVARWHEAGILMHEHVIQQLVSRGVLPGPGEHHGDPATRIIGLVVDTSRRDTAFVNPIQAVVAKGSWQISDSLPFAAGNIQDGLAALLQSSGLQSSGSSEVIPEMLSFQIDDPLGIRSGGPSMDVAGLLAVVDAAGNYESPLLRRACATIEPVKRLDQESSFRAVGSVETKLMAFQREYGKTGSLLIRHSTDKDAAKFDHLFETVWTINNFRQLVDHFNESNLIAPLLNQYSRELDINAVLNRLQWLESQERKHEALDFAKRCQTSASQTGWTPLTVQLQIESKIEDLTRHLGQYFNAIESSETAVRRLKDIGDLASDENIIDAQVRLAAAYHEAHRFQDAFDLLEPVVNHIRKDCRRISVALRCRMFNTLSRTMVVLRNGNWEDLFRTSLTLQEQVEQHNVPRTRNYLIHALLRHGRVEDAQQELELVKQMTSVDQHSPTFLRFYEAELARQQGKLWPEATNDGENGLANAHPRHAMGFYLQATARQPNRSLDDVLQRFAAADEALQEDCPGDPTGNILPVLVQFVRLASSAKKQDTTAWRAAQQEVARLLSHPAADAIRQFYAEVLAACGDTPDPDQAESILQRVPYF